MALGGETSLLLQADYLRDKRVTDFDVPAYRGRPVDVGSGAYYGAANARDVDASQSKVASGTAVLSHPFGESLKFRNALRYYNYSLSRFNTLPGSVNKVTRTVTLNRSNVERDEQGWFDQAELTQNLDLAGGWRAIAGYAYLDARVIRSVAFDAGRPIQGKRATITPEHSANVWLAKALGGRFGFGLGANYVDDRFANPGNTVTLPAYVTADAMVWKRFGPLIAQINVNNLFDANYIVSGHGSSPNLNLPGAPRSAMVTLRYALP